MFKNNLKIIMLGVLLSMSLLPIELCSSISYHACPVHETTHVSALFKSKSFLQRFFCPVLHPDFWVRKHLFMTLGVAGVVTVLLVGYYAGLLSGKNGKNVNKVTQNPSDQQGPEMKHSVLYSLVLWCNVTLPGVMEELPRAFAAMLWSQPIQLAISGIESQQSVQQLQIIDPKQAAKDWTKIQTYLLNMQDTPEGKSSYDMVKDIIESDERLSTALLQNPNTTKVSDAFKIYNWIDFYFPLVSSAEKKERELLVQQQEQFRKKLVVFVKSVSKNDLIKDTNLLKTLLNQKDRALLQFFYEKLGK